MTLAGTAGWLQGAPRRPALVHGEREREGRVRDRHFPGRYGTACAVAAVAFTGRPGEAARGGARRSGAGKT